MLIPILITFVPEIDIQTDCISWESSQVPLIIYASPFYEGCPGIDVQISTTNGEGPSYTEVLPWTPSNEVKEYFIKGIIKEDHIYFQYYCQHIQRELAGILKRWYNQVWGINQPKKLEKPPKIDKASSQLLDISTALEQLKKRLEETGKALHTL